MKKYCIYYITTGSYVNYADNFFNSLVNFMPNCEKTVIWLSDKFNEYNLPNISINHVKILDMPWPLVTLLKMHYIINNKVGGYDGYFYFNGNSKILEMKNEIINLINTSLDNNKFICIKHSVILNNQNYIQAGFFGGNENIFYSICLDVVQRINEYLLNNQIPTWHDETVLNEALYNKEITMKRFALNIEHINKLNEFNNVFILFDNNSFKKYKINE